MIDIDEKIRLAQLELSMLDSGDGVKRQNLNKKMLRLKLRKKIIELQDQYSKLG